MRNVYILLARTNTLYSRAIHAATGDPYTHSSLALDQRLSRMYSFARRWKPLPLVAGFVRERLDQGIYGQNPNAPCLLLEVPLQEDAYARVEAYTAALYAHRFRWHYNYLGVLANYFGKTHIAKRRYFCSEFVADALLRSGGLPFCAEALPFLDPAQVRPNMLARFPGAKPVYEGTLSGLWERLHPWGESARAYPCYTPQPQR